MKRPLSVIIVTKDRATLQEIHHRYDVETRFPRLRLLTVVLRALFAL
jgi:hypothetical protein